MNTLEVKEGFDIYGEGTPVLFGIRLGKRIVRFGRIKYDEQSEEFKFFISPNVTCIGSETTEYVTEQLEKINNNREMLRCQNV